MNTEKLVKLRNFVVRQKVRVDFAMSLLVVVNLALLVVAVSDKLANGIRMVLGINLTYSSYVLVFFIVPAALVCIWLVGFILDKYVRYQHTVTTALNERNPQITEILERLTKIDERTERLEGGRK